MTDNTTRPVFKLRYGSVSAAVWLRNSSTGYFLRHDLYQGLSPGGRQLGRFHVVRKPRPA